MLHKMLVVSSHDEDINIARSAAAEESVVTTVAQTYRQAVTAAAKDAFGLILCRDSLPDGTWKDLFSHVVVVPEPPRVIVIADPSDHALWAEAMSIGAYDIVANPLNRPEAHQIIFRALAMHSARREDRSECIAAA
jgi:DNA-binding NtrC family response regulator